MEIPELGLTKAIGDSALRLLALPHQRARLAAQALPRNIYGVAYQPSVLRQTPIFGFGDRLRAPLRDLILARVTAGIYYDLVGGPADLRNEIGDRFEAYSCDLLQSLVPSYESRRSYRYMVNARPFDTPDILMSRGGRTRVALECKAKKMTLEACFSEAPLEEAEVGFDELAKGVFQLWRFFSHCRRNLVDEVLADDVSGVVLTLDNWLTASRDFEPTVLNKAREMARARDPEIAEADMRPVIFCPIESLEGALLHTTEESLFAALAAAATEKYRGWMLANVAEEVGQRERRPYPFHVRLGEVLPWWARMKELAPDVDD